MDIEELEPRKKKPEPKNLEAMGVEELEAYLAELDTALARVKTEIEGKQSYLAGAGAFVKS